VRSIVQDGAAGASGTGSASGTGGASGADDAGDVFSGYAAGSAAVVNSQAWI